LPRPPIIRADSWCSDCGKPIPDDAIILLAKGSKAVWCKAVKSRLHIGRVLYSVPQDEEEVS